ncbi:MAG TPA: hypothetical protein VMZ90_01520 [Vicinamibacterales bacterium]|nr:hypothetical protein [Vicinamibacterales bacterium]
MSVAAIRALYFNASQATVERDLFTAIKLFKALETEDERDKAAVYMEGLSQMRSEWGVRPSRAAGPRGPRGQASKKPGGR